jgi:predicted transglutaminase-like cysteine proteinase
MDAGGLAATKPLLVTVVLEKNESHAVLTVTNDRGDYLLDNLNKNILLWSTTDYRFVKRQSQANPNGWVSLVRQAPDRHCGLKLACAI